jgi:hypothetical protein
MALYVADPWGNLIENASPSKMLELLAALDTDDEEHGAVWLTDEFGRCLEMNSGGRVVWSVPGVPPRHMVGLDIHGALRLWLRLAENRIDEIESELWLPGSRPPLLPEQQAAREQEAQRLEFERDRLFFESLGAERRNVSCRREQCARGAISKACSVGCTISRASVARAVRSIIEAG